MATEIPQDKHPDLELRIGGDEVLLKHLVAASDRFSALINEVARTYTGAAAGSIRWVVEVKEGSVRLPLHGSPVSDAVAAPAIHELADVIAKGVALIEKRPERPDYFTDKALEKAKELAKVPEVCIRNGAAPIELTGHLMANVDQLLGKPKRVFGTVEGRLEKLDIHGPSNFIVYSSLTGKSVKCRFGKYVSLEEVTAAVGKRVGARGLVERRPNGEQVSVDVQELRVLPEPVSADEVVGIFQGYDEVEA